MHIDGLLIATDRRVVVAHSLKKVAPAEDTTTRCATGAPR